MKCTCIHEHSLEHSLERSLEHFLEFSFEFLEFEFRSSGRLRYANNSNYKNDVMIRKEAYIYIPLQPPLS